MFCTCTYLREYFRNCLIWFTFSTLIRNEIPWDIYFFQSVLFIHKYTTTTGNRYIEAVNSIICQLKGSNENLKPRSLDLKGANAKKINTYMDMIIDFRGKCRYVTKVRAKCGHWFVFLACYALKWSKKNQILFDKWDFPFKILIWAKIHFSINLLSSSEVNIVLCVNHSTLSWNLAAIVPDITNTLLIFLSDCILSLTLCLFMWFHSWMFLLVWPTIPLVNCTETSPVLRLETKTRSWSWTLLFVGMNEMVPCFLIRVINILLEINLWNTNSEKKITI